MITLALPCYNEELNILSVLNECVTELNKLDRLWEIVVIDNNSKDHTADVVQDFAKCESRVRIVVHPENRYYSGSCATALREARGDYIAIMDSDGQFSASDLPKMLARLEGGANLVMGWRKQRHDPLFRLLMSKVFNAMGRLRLGYPLHDLNCGIRMFDRRLVEVAEIRHRINMVNPELYVRASNADLNIVEIPIRHAERVKGNTSHNLIRIWRIFIDVDRYLRALRAELKPKR